MIYEAKEFILKDNTVVTFRTPEVSEAQELLNFIKTAVGQTDYLLSSPEDIKLTVEQEEAFIESNKNSNSYFIAAYVDGKIIGDCCVNYGRHLKDKHRGNIGITVDEKYWNKGIGSIMFDEMIRLSRNVEGIEQLELGVNSENPRAKHLYEKKGFVKFASIPRALKLKDGTYCDEELMVLFL